MCLLQKVINQFAQLGEDPRVTFFGNVKAGQDVTLSELRALFEGVRLFNCPGTCENCMHSGNAFFIPSENNTLCNNSMFEIGVMYQGWKVNVIAATESKHC
jgi:hypothetical protein